MVYVVQDQGRNITQATKFGEIRILLPQKSQISFSPGFVTNELRKKLSDFNDTDFLLLMGDPVAIGLAVAIAAYWNQGKVKMLKWDRQDKLYYPVSINIYPKTEVLDEPGQQ